MYHTVAAALCFDLLYSPKCTTLRGWSKDHIHSHRHQNHAPRRAFVLISVIFLPFFFFPPPPPAFPAALELPSPLILASTNAMLSFG